MWVVELRPQETINELVEKSLKKDNIFDLWSLINSSTENELRDLFADWINKNVKKRMDYYNLCAIQFDIDRLKNKKPNAKKPEWFDKENNVEEITKEELKSMEWLDE